MAEPTCPLCQSTGYRRLFSVSNHDLLSCDQCDLIYISPYPEDAGSVYESVTDYNYEHLEIMSADAHFESSQLAYGRIYPQIRPYYEEANTTLDVGCGTGYLLKRLQQDFPELHRVGIELNKARAQFARQAAECEIIETPVQALDAADRFDVITLIAVFSHAPDFQGLYTKLRELLPKHGKLILHAGEFSRDVKPTAVFDWEVPDHLHFMGMSTAEKLGQQFGLRLVARQREPIENVIFSINTWKAPGRSRLRNAIKGAVAHVPGLLPLLKSAYTARHGGTVYNSILVYEPA